MKILHLDTNHKLLMSQLNELGFINHEDYNSSKEMIEIKIQDYDGIILRSRFSIDKQFIDAGKQLIQPQTLELATSIFVGSKIPSFKLPTVSKGVGLSDDVLLNLSDDAFVHITPSLNIH